MRVFSDKLLGPQEILKAKYANFSLHNAHLFKIYRLQPALVATSSSIELLTKNRKYYMYENITDYTKKTPVYNYMDVIGNSKPSIHIWLPFTVRPHDILLIHDDYGCNAIAPLLA